VVITGRVRTLDRLGTVAEAVAVRGTQVLATGSAADMRELAGPRTHIVELAGATVVPGFNDVHAHMEREGLKRIRPSLADCRSVADIKRLIANLAAKALPGAWIVTMPLGEPPFFYDGVTGLAEGRPPDRHDLDELAPDNPVCIPGLFGNWGTPPGYTCLNSRALEVNGVTRETAPSVSGIEILKDQAGEPTGVIVERNPRPMVEFDVLRAVPRFTRAERLTGLRESMRLYNAVGTTSIYEGHGCTAETIGLYRELQEKGELTVRAGLVVSPAWADVEEAAVAMRDWLAHARGAGIGDDGLNLSGVHLAFGGDPCMADVARRDLPNSGWSGFVEQANDPDMFEALCRLLARHDLRLNTIVSDRLADVVAILERVAADHPIAGRRWVIQHIGKTDRRTLERLARLGVLVTTIPVYFVWKGNYDLTDGANVTPMRTMIDLGLAPSAATDNIPYNPGFTLWTMCERVRRDGAVLGPAERIGRDEALAAMTVAGAPLTFDEERKGRLDTGWLADLAVLDIDPLTAGSDDLKTLASRLTMVGGAIVHRQT